MKGFKGGFIPPELETNESRSRKESTQNWQGSSDHEESLSDPRWHKRPPTKGKKGKPDLNTSSTTPVRDAREELSAKKKIKTSTKSTSRSSSRTRIHLETQRSPTPKDTMKKTQTQTETHNTTTTTHTVEPQNTTTTTQTPDRSKDTAEISTTTTQTPDKSKDTAEICVSRVDPTIRIEEELTHNVEPPTMGPPTQPATKWLKDRNLRPLIIFVEKRDWEAIEASYGQYWHNIRNRLHVREDCLHIDERIVIPTQLRQTVLDSLHLTHPGSAAMLDVSNHVCFPHIHRAIVQMAQNCKHCNEQGKNLKPIIGKKNSFQMEPIVEQNEEVQFDFARPLPDELKRDAYILVAIDKWYKFPTTKVVTNTTADIAIKFMQRYISNNGAPRRLIYDQAQTFRVKKFQLFCNTNNIKLLFAPVDDHRAIGVVKRMIQSMKRRLAVMKIDKTNTPYKLASAVAEIIKTLRIT